jgi:hypothetical protein
MPVEELKVTKRSSVGATCLNIIGFDEFGLKLILKLYIK